MRFTEGQILFVCRFILIRFNTFFLNFFYYPSDMCKPLIPLYRYFKTYCFKHHLADLDSIVGFFGNHNGYNRVDTYILL